MNVGDLIDFLETYDRTAEVEVEVHFVEAGGASASTFDVTTFSLAELASGLRNGWPTITAGIGLGTMAENELRLVIDHVKGIDRRLGYHGDVS